MFKFLDKIVGLFSLIAMIGLLGAYSARYVNPNIFVLPSLLGLAYPYLLLGNIILLFYWITRWKKWAFIQLFVILLGIPTFMSYYGTNSDNPEKQDNDLFILSYNVRYFDRYGWNKEKNTKEKLVDYLNRFKGNITCLQEFPPAKYTIKPGNIIHQLPTYPYHWIKKNMAIFSKCPLVAQGEIIFDKKDTGSCIYCDIKCGKDTVRIYNIHLESYKLGVKERKFVKEIQEGTGNDIPQGIKNIMTRIMDANKNRARQAIRIKKHMRQSPYPVIVCGDFNDTPLSYTYRIIDKDMKDSFIEKGRGLGNTYIGEFPSFRIDYILHSPDFLTIGYNRESITLSDHYPICCKLKIRK